MLKFDKLKKKIVILETAVSYQGVKRGGSYLQAKYYNDLLNKKGHISTIYIGNPKVNAITKVISIINAIRLSDYVVGFGTPLLNIYLQWLCFFFGKIGVFCTDTIIVELETISDHLKRNLYKKRFIILSVIQHIISFLITKIPPPKLNLINIVSCQYVNDKLIKTSLHSKESRFLHPVVEVNRRGKREKELFKKVLYYGALYRGRGVIDLLNACRLLWQKGYQFKLIIMGWPIERYTKISLLAEITDDEKEKIIIKGKDGTILDIIKDVTVVVLPFRYPCSFQTPYTLLEPMGLGIPVITTDVGSHTEWILNGKTGLICKKENPQDIADKIEIVFNDAKLVDKITSGASAILKQKYNEEDMILKILKRLGYEK